MISTCAWLFSVCSALVEGRAQGRLTQAIKVNELAENMEISQNLFRPVEDLQQFFRDSERRTGSFQACPLFFPEISPPCQFPWIFSSVGELCFVKRSVTDGRSAFSLGNRESLHFFFFHPSEPESTLLRYANACLSDSVPQKFTPSCENTRLKMTKCLCGLGP